MKVIDVIQDLVDDLLTRELKAESINLKKILRISLENAGYLELQSTELAAQWAYRLKDVIEIKLQEWDMLGIPRPIIETNSDLTLFTFKHPQYFSILGSDGLPKNYMEILSFIQSLSTKDFLVVSLFLLYLSGCNPIIFTDGAGDGGVDCMGQINLGPMRSLCVFVQSKAGPSKKYIDKNVLRSEHAKFSDLTQSTVLFSRYLAALGKSNSMDGKSICYKMITNSEFEKRAREYAYEKGILVRSVRQSAYWLSLQLSVEQLEKSIICFKPYLKQDLDFNFYSLIESSLNS